MAEANEEENQSCFAATNQIGQPMLPCQIVKIQEGKLKLEKENLLKILNHAVDIKDYPVAFLAIIGPPQGGKSFLTNMLIELLENPDYGGWMEKLIQKGEFTKGFHFDSVINSEKLIKQDSDASSIYMWPAPFLIKRSNGEKVVIWLLDYHVKTGASKEDEIIMEEFLGFCCSRVMEINTDQTKFRLANMNKKFPPAQDQVPRLAICSSVVVLFLTNNSSSRKVYQGEEDVLKLLKSLNVEIKMEDTLLDQFQYLNAMGIMRCPDQLHDNQGRFNKDAMKSQGLYFKTALKAFVEEDEIQPKEDVKKKWLTSSKIPDFLDECVNYIHQLRSKEASSFSNGKINDLKTIHENFKDQTKASNSDYADNHASYSMNHGRFSSSRESMLPSDSLSDGNLHGCRGDNHISLQDELLAIKRQDDDNPPTDHTKSTSRAKRANALETQSLKFTEYSKESPIKFDNKHSTSLHPTPAKRKLIPTAIPNPVTGKINSNNSDLLQFEKPSISSEQLDRRGDQTMPKNQSSLFEPEPDSEKFQVLVQHASSQIEESLPSHTSQWITNNLNPENIKSFSSIYNRCLQTILDASYFKSFNPYIREEFEKRVHKKNKNLIMSFLLPIFGPVDRFNTIFMEEFNRHIYFTNQKFNQLATEITSQVTRGLKIENPQITELMHSAINKIRLSYERMNHFVVMEEIGIMDDVSKKILHFHEKEIQNYLEKYGVFNRTDLLQIHQNVVLLILESVKKIICPSSSQPSAEILESSFTDLENALHKNYENLKKSNEVKLKTFQLEIRKIVSSGYSGYVRKIEGVLETNPHGYDPELLERDHNAISEEQVNLLKIEVRKRIRENEPVQGYCEALLYQIGHYWPEVQNVNKMNLEKKQRNLIQSSVSSLSGQSHSQTQSNALIFKLSYSYMSMGTQEGEELIILKNPQGEEKTPLIVGINRNGDIIYGTDAVTQCHSQPQSENLSLDHWWITDYLGTSFSPSFQKTITINVGGTERKSYNLNVEFLLAYFFRSMKQNAQKQLSRNFSTAVITIPFWYASTHRIQIKDAATIAGFTDVYLANEESAAAYSTAKQNGMSVVNVLVLSQTHGVVSAISYLYSKSEKQLKMENFSFMNWRTEMKGKVSKFNLFRSIGNPSPKSNDIELKTNFVRKVCRNLFQTNFDESIFITDSGNDEDFVWLKAFEDVVNIRESWNDQSRVNRVDIPKFKSFPGIFGIFLIGKAEKIGSYLRDSLNYDIMVKNRGNNLELDRPKVVIAAENLKSIWHTDDIQSISYSVKISRKETCFYQQNIFDDKPIPIGQLKIEDSVYASSKQVFAVFEISSEAIVKLIGVKIRYATSKNQEVVEINNFQWNKTNKCDFTEEIESMQEILPEDQTRQTIASEEINSDEIIDAKKLLRQFCELLEKGMHEGVYKFKTEISMALFLKRIERARSLLQDSDSEIMITKEIETLKQVHNKYSK